MPGAPIRISGLNRKPGNPSRAQARRPCQTTSVAEAIHGISACRAAAISSASCSVVIRATATPPRRAVSVARSRSGRWWVPVPLCSRSKNRIARRLIMAVSASWIRSNQFATCVSDMSPGSGRCLFDVRIFRRASVSRSSSLARRGMSSRNLISLKGIVVVERVMAESFQSAARVPRRCSRADQA